MDPSQTLELITASSFSSSNFEIYDEVINNGYLVNYALQDAKHQTLSRIFIKRLFQHPNPSHLLALVNKNYQLDSSYVPTDFVPLDVPLSTYAVSETNYLRRDAADATENLFKQALEDGIELLLRTDISHMRHRKIIMSRIFMIWALKYARESKYSTWT